MKTKVFVTIPAVIRHSTKDELKAAISDIENEGISREVLWCSLGYSYKTLKGGKVRVSRKRRALS